MWNLRSKLTLIPRDIGIKMAHVYVHWSPFPLQRALMPLGWTWHNLKVGFVFSHVASLSTRAYQVLDLVTWIASYLTWHHTKDSFKKKVKCQQTSSWDSLIVGAHPVAFKNFQLPRATQCPYDASKVLVRRCEPIGKGPIFCDRVHHRLIILWNTFTSFNSHMAPAIKSCQHQDGPYCPLV